MVIAKADVAVSGNDSESLTVMPNENVPLAVGAPLMVPLLERANPAGNEPEARLQI